MINNRIEELEKIKRIARNFVIDASGSWETGEGDLILQLCKEYDEKYLGKSI